MNEPIKWFNPTGLFNKPKNFGQMNIVGGKIIPRATAFILMFNTLTSSVSGDFSPMQANPRLDARFLIRRDNELIRTQWPSLPHSFVEIKCGAARSKK
jgi:hypothetical protein